MHRNAQFFVVYYYHSHHSISNSWLAKFSEANKSLQLPDESAAVKNLGVVLDERFNFDDDALLYQVVLLSPAET